MTCITISIISPGFVIVSCAIGNGMGYVLTRAAQLESITIAIAAIAMVGSNTFCNCHGIRLSIQVPAII